MEKVSSEAIDEGLAAGEPVEPAHVSSDYCRVCSTISKYHTVNPSLQISAERDTHYLSRLHQHCEDDVSQRNQRPQREERNACIDPFSNLLHVDYRAVSPLQHSRERIH